jgi:hypothetical protein
MPVFDLHIEAEVHELRKHLPGAMRSKSNERSTIWHVTPGLRAAAP